MWDAVSRPRDRCAPRHIPYGKIVYDKLYSYNVRCRPYSAEYTGSHLNSEVKQWKARLVLGWGTPRELLRVLTAFMSSKLLHELRSSYVTLLKASHCWHCAARRLLYSAPEYLNWCRPHDEITRITRITQASVRYSIRTRLDTASSYVRCVSS